MFVELPSYKRRWYAPWSFVRRPDILPQDSAEPLLIRLRTDRRLFTLHNTKLPLGTIGLFSITSMTDDDFSSASIQLDVDQIRANGRRLDVTLRHELGHAIYAIEHPAEIVALQRIINTHKPSPLLSSALEPTETFAKSMESII